jgi:hypothetical protein
MAGVIKSLRKRIFSISPEETRFTRRGFMAGDPRIQSRLERIGQIFVQGYNAALEDDAAELPRELNSVEPEFRGFAFEGAAMGLALLDYFSPSGGSRVKAFLAGPGRAHAYMVHVGAGWTLARLPQDVKKFLGRFDPILRWLAVDGYGFHEGYFKWRRYFQQHARPRKLSGYALRVFDQGLGRSLWFIECADVARIASTIAGFPVARHGDLWSGVGLACAYAGGVNRYSLERLRRSAASYLPCVAQGVAFAAKARQRAGNPAQHTELACQVMCGLPADMAARITDVALGGLLASADQPLYEVWRQKVQAQFAKEAAIV